MKEVKTSCWEDVKDTLLIGKLKRRLLSIDKEHWLSIGHTFNGWKFPVTFYDLIPKWWSKDWYTERAYKVIRPIMEIINEAFTDKEQLKFHNVEKGCMTEAEFEQWYENSITRGDGLLRFYERRKNFRNIEWWKDDVYRELIESKLVKS